LLAFAFHKGTVKSQKSQEKRQKSSDQPFYFPKIQAFQTIYGLKIAQKIIGITITLINKTVYNL